MNQISPISFGSTFRRGDAVVVTYDALGNIRSKSDVCSAANCFAYGGGGAGPHALTAIAGVYNGVLNPSFSYDANGNMTGGAGRSVTLTSFNMAAAVSDGANAVSLTYDSEHKRIVQVATGANAGTTLYLNDPASGAMAEKFTTAVASSWRDYIMADGRMVALRTSSGATTTLSYFVLDYLGSIAAIADAAGNVVERDYYDAWGRRRNGDGTPDPGECAIGSAVTRGFTGQEMMQGVCLINFNARLYDPALGRFMSADPLTQSYYDLQLLNRYSYVGNNPLSLTDPTGLCFLGCFWNQGWFRDIFAVVIAFVLEQPWALPSLESTLFGEAFGAVANGAIIGGIAGGIQGGTTRSVLLGALQAGLFAEAGNLLQPIKVDIVAYQIDKLVTHGFVGGLVSMVGGGKFGAGFLAAAIAAQGPEPTGDEGAAEIAAETAESAILGGVGSLLGGGKFANGAVTGAFGYLFNSCAHTDCWGAFKQDAGNALDWAAGTGPANRFYGPDSPNTIDMEDAPGVNAAREGFYQKNAAAIAAGNYDALQSYTDVKGDFGLLGYLKAFWPFSFTQHFIGSYRIDVTPWFYNTSSGTDYYVEFTLTNDSSFRSFAYGIAPDWERSTFGPMGNMRQTYTWSEPLRH